MSPIQIFMVVMAFVAGWSGRETLQLWLEWRKKKFEEAMRCRHPVCECISTTLSRCKTCGELVKLDPPIEIDRASKRYPGNQPEKIALHLDLLQEKRECSTCEGGRWLRLEKNPPRCTTCGGKGWT
jgi:hypothetical protein